MFKFRWSDLVSDEFVGWVCKSAGASPIRIKEDVKGLLGAILERMGGPAVSHSRFDDKASSMIAMGLLEDALREAFPSVVGGHEPLGSRLDPIRDGPFQNEIVQANKLHMNWDSSEVIAGQPGVGAVLARRIVSERHAGGPFKNARELLSRVKGIDAKALGNLGGALDFGPPPSATRADEISDLIGLTVAASRATPEEGLVHVLEYTAANAVKRAPRRWHSLRLYTASLPADWHSCSWAGILRGADYHKWLLASFADAQKSIEIAMFHAAMPSQKHPTKELLQKLVDARNRGVSVRVLLDSDRKEDPYKSTVINKPAKKFLEKSHVEVRFDAEEQLLHSKFVLIDSEVAVLGSHNWSAGSYFRYDDLSVAVKSESLVAELRQRFDRLWTAAGKGANRDQGRAKKILGSASTS